MLSVCQLWRSYVRLWVMYLYVTFYYHPMFKSNYESCLILNQFSINVISAFWLKKLTRHKKKLWFLRLCWSNAASTSTPSSLSQNECSSDALSLVVPDSNYLMASSIFHDLSSSSTSLLNLQTRQSVCQSLSFFSLFLRRNLIVGLCILSDFDSDLRLQGQSKGLWENPVEDSRFFQVISVI